MAVQRLHVSWLLPSAADEALKDRTIAISDGNIVAMNRGAAMPTAAAWRCRRSPMPMIMHGW